jgi:hypothetical protein
VHTDEGWRGDEIDMIKNMLRDSLEEKSTLMGLKASIVMLKGGSLSFMVFQKRSSLFICAGN